MLSDSVRRRELTSLLGPHFGDGAGDLPLDLVGRHATEGLVDAVDDGEVLPSLFLQVPQNLKVVSRDEGGNGHAVLLNHDPFLPTEDLVQELAEVMARLGSGDDLVCWFSVTWNDHPRTAQCATALTCRW